MTNNHNSASRACIFLNGEVTIYRAAELREILKVKLTEGRSLNIDLNDVLEIDSAGVQLLLSAQKTAARDGRSVYLVAPSKAVMEVFALLAITERLSTESDPSDEQKTGGHVSLCEEGV